MKTKDEIKKLANEWSLINSDDTMESNSSLNKGYVAGYTQCEEDNKYSEEDIRKVIFTSFLLGVDRGNYSKELEDKLIEQFKETI
jgi:hypothetical protein